MATPNYEQLGDLAERLVRTGWLSPKAAAPLLGVSYPTVMEYIKKGHIHAFPVGPRWRIPEDEIIRFRKEGSRLNQQPVRPELMSEPSESISTDPQFGSQTITPEPMQRHPDDPEY